MDDDLDPEEILSILLQLVVGHYYERDIITILPEAAKFVSKNKQVTQVIKTIRSTTTYTTSKKINWHDLDKNAQDIVNDFFEYLYFTSSDFLGEVK